jgi:hypothetical protein
VIFVLALFVLKPDFFIPEANEEEEQMTEINQGNIK